MLYGASERLCQLLHCRIIHVGQPQASRAMLNVLTVDRCLYSLLGGISMLQA
jgi:hypothetical protein